MAKPNKGGRPSLYPGKKKGYRVQGRLSDDGATIFERVRRNVAEHIDRKVALVSDADVIERAVRFYDKQIGSL